MLIIIETNNQRMPKARSNNKIRDLISKNERLSQELRIIIRER